MERVFHKLSRNTKHVKFQLHMSLWWSFVQNGFYVHFSCIFRGVPTCSHVAKIAQGLKGMVLRKKFTSPIESWFFTFFSLLFLFMVLHDIIFIVDFLKEILQGPQFSSFESKILVNKKNFSLLIITNMELKFECHI